MAFGTYSTPSRAELVKGLSSVGYRFPGIVLDTLRALGYR